jgi:hypothetical protein
MRSGGSHDPLLPSIREGHQGRFIQGGASSRRVSMSHETERELPPRRMPLWGWDPTGVRSSFDPYGGLIRLALAWLENLNWRYRQFKQIRRERVARVVFVCHGNIRCSPHAEGRAASFSLPAASFGLSAASGAPADPSACVPAAAIRRAIPPIGWSPKYAVCSVSTKKVARTPNSARLSRRKPKPCSLPPTQPSTIGSATGVRAGSSIAADAEFCVDRDADRDRFSGIHAL